MKSKLIYLGLLLFTLGVICNGQWTEIDPDTLGVFRAVKFNNQTDGLILGRDGVVMKTTNQGESWKHLRNDLNVDFFDFQFMNDTIIYAYGSDKIYMSTDSGNSWTEKSSLPSGAQFAYFLDPEIGFAGGNISGLRRTNNGGSTWSIVWIYPGENVSYSEQNDIDFINDSVGFACGRAWKSGVGGFGNIIKTVDRGMTWSIAFESSTAYQVTHPINIQILNNLFVIAIDDNFDLIRTENFGETWSVVSFVEPDPGTWYGMTATSMYSLNLDTILVSAETTVWLVKSGCDSKRKILRTTNGGQNWIVQFLEVVDFQDCGTPLMNDLTFINDTVGIAIGNNLIMRSTNLGGDVHIPDSIIFKGIENHSLTQSGIKIFPNPTSGNLTVEINNGEYSELDVYTLSGKKIKTLQLNKINTIDLTTYPAGLYILRFSGKKIYYHRIIRTEQ